MDILEIIASTAGISTAVKLLVDVLKKYLGPDLQPWVLPMAALALGLFCSFGFIAMQPETIWNVPTFVGAIFRGVFGGIGAVGLTEGHKMARGQR